MLRPGCGDFNTVLVLLGDAVARDLCSDFPGHCDHATGWRGGLQTAVEHSDPDRELLRIADELYALAIRAPTFDAINGYVNRTCWECRTQPARAFMQGMRGHLDDRSGHRRA